MAPLPRALAAFDVGVLDEEEPVDAAGLQVPDGHAIRGGTSSNLHEDCPLNLGHVLTVPGSGAGRTRQSDGAT